MSMDQSSQEGLMAQEFEGEVTFGSQKALSECALSEQNVPSGRKRISREFLKQR